MVVQTVIHGYPPNTDNDTQLIRVRLLRGQKIGRRDLFGVCSPYCLVRLENSNGDVVDEVQVETKRKTRHPVWNSVFTFRVTRSCQLKLLVYDENRLRKDSLIGFVSRSMDDSRISTQAPNPEEYPLATSSTSSKGKSIGSLLLTFHFVPSSSDNSPADSTADLQQQQTTSHGMPQGWEEREDGNGRTVYINHALRTTQFTPPESIPDGNTDAITEQSVIEETRRRRDNYEHRSQVTDEPSDTAVVSNELTAVSSGFFSRFVFFVRSTFR
ncbi:hypothetical protein B9Z55_000663 [Caenorhabditis nigoni]|uniref:C2 domain-containing protein n=1 Tax=Caenorhabditis nigoni TaxID=1611254 RepID=A0A2G5VU82_9PELO|nr:hypothetical protein B9Z55_000663 [Caenorhabditis nigoni]